MQMYDVMNELVKDFKLGIEEVMKNSDMDINQKVNTLCYTVEVVSACMAEIARSNAPDAEHETNRITLDYMLEAILDKRCKEFGTATTGGIQ